MNTAGKRALNIPVSDRLLEVASWKWGRTGNRVTTSQLTYKVLSCLTYLPKSRYAMLLPLALPSWDLTLSFILMFSNFELIYSISCLLLAPEFHGLATTAGVLLVSVCAFVWFCALYTCHLLRLPEEGWFDCLCFQYQCGAYLLFRAINQYISRWVHDKLDKSVLACLKIDSEVNV